MGDGGAKEEANRARMDEALRQDRISQGTKTIRKKFATAFNDDYYKNFETAAQGFYKPQLDTQYADSLKNLQAALARSGLSESSARTSQEGRLNREFGTAQDQVTNNIRNQLNARKSDVANQETVAVNQLQSSADPAAAAAQAESLIKSQTALPGWSPLGQVFTDASSYLATQGDLERAGTNRYNAGVSRFGDNTRRYLQNVGR